MRTTTVVTLIGAAALTALAGCTVKDIDAPPLAGPSTFAHSIILRASDCFGIAKDTLQQDGRDSVCIEITSLGPTGQSEALDVRAQIYVDGIAQDFGLLSTKSAKTPATIRYTAPASPVLASAQQPTTVTIAVTPSSAGDFRGEFTRQIDLRLLPQGVILPTNPNLIANFTATPATPKAFDLVNFDASSSTNNGTPCLGSCGYSWTFGDGGTASGITTTHSFTNPGNTSVTLTITDPRGAQASKTIAIAVSAPTPPTVAFDFTPTIVGVNQDVFFTAVASTPATGRRIVSYEWNFGDGGTGSGSTTSHKYSSQGTFIVTLKATDDVGAFATAQKTVTVGEGLPTVSLNVLPATPKANQVVTVNVTATPFGSATIATYAFSWGDGSPVETSNTPTQSHTYGAGNFVIAVTVTDSLGRSKTTTAAIIVTP